MVDNILELGDLGDIDIGRICFCAACVFLSDTVKDTGGGRVGRQGAGWGFSRIDVIQFDPSAVIHL